MESQNVQVVADVPWQWYPLQVQGPASRGSKLHAQRLTTSDDTSVVPLVSSAPALPSMWPTSASTPVVSIRMAGLRSKSTENVLSGDRWPGSGVGKVVLASARSLVSAVARASGASKAVEVEEMEMGEELICVLDQLARLRSLLLSFQASSYSLMASGACMST